MLDAGGALLIIGQLCVRPFFAAQIMKLRRSVQTERESSLRCRVPALHRSPVLVTGSAHVAQGVGSEFKSRSAGCIERRSEFQFGDETGVLRCWSPNQIASVNRRYRSALRLGLEFGRGSHDSAHLTAPVTELCR